MSEPLKFRDSWTQPPAPAAKPGNVTSEATAEEPQPVAKRDEPPLRADFERAGMLRGRR
jgi:hypothetical protein